MANPERCSRLDQHRRSEGRSSDGKAADEFSEPKGRGVVSGARPGPPAPGRRTSEGPLQRTLLRVFGTRVRSPATGPARVSH